MSVIVDIYDNQTDAEAKSIALKTQFPAYPSPTIIPCSAAIFFDHRQNAASYCISGANHSCRIEGTLYIVVSNYP